MLGTLNVLMITSNDPAGMGIAFTNAINRYTPHRCRLITTETKYSVDFASDLHLPDLDDRGWDEVETLLKTSDIFHFHILTDEDFPLGPFIIRDYLKGKRLLNHHHGHPYFMANSALFRRKYQERRRRVLVSTPDLLRLLPEATWIPNLVPLWDVDHLPRPDGYLATSPVRLVQAPTRRYHKHTKEFLRIASALAARRQDVEVLLIENRSHRECLRTKRQSHIVFDHMQGHFGISSLESLAQGTCVVSGLDEGNLKWIAEFTGTSRHPWVLAHNEAELERELEALVMNPARRVEVGRYARQYMEERWNERLVVERLIRVYEEL